MKRFWTKAEAVEVDGGFGIELDGRQLKTPARTDLVLPTRDLGLAIAAEWAGCGKTVDPRAMPLTGLANAATDRVADDPERFARGLAAYAESDLTCYRAVGPASLVARQAGHWDAALDWARRRFDVDFACVRGVMHAPQPGDTLRKLGHEVALLDPFRLAGLSPLVTIGGSLVIGLAVLEGAMTADDAWQAVTIDEHWQLEQWGSDAEAENALEARRSDFLAGSRFLELLA